MVYLCLPSLFLTSLPALFCSLSTSHCPPHTNSISISLKVFHSLSVHMLCLSLPLGFLPPSLSRFHGFLCITFLNHCISCVWIEIHRRMV
ncbi:hypothetical protein AMTRI_Chr12g239040 [Amborella trichopoda]